MEKLSRYSWEPWKPQKFSQANLSPFTAVYRQHIVIITLLLRAQSIVRLPVKYTQVAHDKVREGLHVIVNATLYQHKYW